MIAKPFAQLTTLASSAALVSVLALPSPALADNDALKKFLLLGAAALVVKTVIDNQQHSTPAPAAPTTALSHTEIVNVQYDLNRAGYYFGRIDGTWGDQTKQAAANWQRAYGYPATGVFTNDQREQLQRIVSGGYYSASNSPIVSTPLTPPVYNGTSLTRSQLSTLQSDLQFLGYYSGSIDGIWGRQSQAALEQFRLEQGVNSKLDYRAQPGAIDLTSIALSARELEQDISTSLQQKLARADH
jgi:peptidoglycan hydrolase-like protein with peptidoglycan-binding domain